MTAQEYLEKAREASRAVRAIIRQLEQMNDERYSITKAIDPDTIHTGFTSSRLESLTVSIVDRQMELIEKAQALLRLRDEVTAVIDALDDLKQRIVLRERYIAGMKWQDIAEVMGVDTRTVYRYHADALELIKVPE